MPVIAPGLAGAPPVALRFVAYYRVSTDRQGKSGLGLDAQRAAVAKYVAGIDGIVAAEFEEVESGKRNDRPQLAAALAACRARRAALVCQTALKVGFSCTSRAVISSFRGWMST